ncbi:MAG TPA: hypothetical protein VN648_21535, partial [Candidatus Methylomirabilis sp.]|nr:hypothetical protein [Candidatus Methylomirabilis sp.]
PARRSTLDLIGELRAAAARQTLAAIAVGFDESTQFVFPTDPNPLDALNRLVLTGGTPLGILGVRIAQGTIEYQAKPFAEFCGNPRIQEHLHLLRDRFLALLRTHVERWPESPRYN